MKIFSSFWLLLLLCILSDHLVNSAKLRKKRSAFFKSLKVIQVIPALEGIFKEIISLWNRPLQGESQGIFFSQNSQLALLESLRQVSSRIGALEESVKNHADVVLTTLLQEFSKMVHLELKLEELTSIFNQINFAEDKMNEYLILGYRKTNTTEVSHNTDSITGVSQTPRDIMKRETHSKRFVEKFTLEDFATGSVGHGSNSLMRLLRNLNNLIVTDNIFYSLREALEETRGGYCNLGESPHQVLYNLYVKTALAQLKGNAILQFSYMILKLYNKGDFADEAKSALHSYERYTERELEVVRNILSEADRSFYKCDPKQYVYGVTYTKLTRLLQGYIENEVNLNPYGTCRENCRYYTFTEYNSCYQKQFCAKQPPCKGKVLNCNYVDSDMKICTSSDGERRYDWVQYKRGKSLGNTGVCESRRLFAVDSWWRYLFWHCSYCLCLCDGGDDFEQQSDRYFNLRDVTSDIEKNKVLTGVRIVKNNRVIHFQIQQGVLTPGGIVNKTTLSWKPVDNYTLTDPNVQNDVDYHTMSWLERAIDVDDVVGPPEHAVTGIRLRKIGVHLNLEIRVTPINFTTGEVFEQYSYWLGNDNTDVNANDPRTEIKLSEPDIPIRKGPHFLNSKHNQYIVFQASSMKTDVGQSTVPYLDTQTLVSEGTPISGIGLIHRGKEGSGGFIAPKIISYDFTPHLRFNKNA